MPALPSSPHPTDRQSQVLVTGAAGKTGRTVIAALRARGANVRALVRRPDQPVSC
ncbi:MAG: NmrA family NAD(P)-binding protein [Anaerolineae bacterium]|nr:NmrA family NAD(P)-binding protein [Anaerolineae bacterium]MCB9133091.1 NmrA family NAD(P)-binding protein [Anaerolineales bacterium]MCB0231923.1 NmrA family NAD(P)-binding protein [Anaerolineae bacterium]MCB0237892.1 NmrA family NAD(P)-binding protein [Anaerolineae bacterium]MCB0248510.1 NmrA family NAD(P)-binding protein [Anaerolineae bacterium]